MFEDRFGGKKRPSAPLPDPFPTDYEGLEKAIFKDPSNVPELARNVGIPVGAGDCPDASTVAMILSLAQRVKKLEERLSNDDHK